MKQSGNDADGAVVEITLVFVVERRVLGIAMNTFNQSLTLCAHKADHSHL